MTSTMLHFYNLYRPEDVPDFRSKNRYFDILPYEYNLVPAINSDGEKVYVNASYIDIPIKDKGERTFIAASGPIRKYMDLWWDMIVTNKVELVCMLCRFTEKGLPKCDEYFS